MSRCKHYALNWRIGVIHPARLIRCPIVPNIGVNRVAILVKCLNFNSIANPVTHSNKAIKCYGVYTDV